MERLARDSNNTKCHGLRAAATGLTGMVASDVARQSRGAVDWVGLAARLPGETALIASALRRSGAGVVVNYAAYTDVRAAAEEYGAVSGPCYTTNVTGARRLAEACRDSNVFLVHISTDYVFEGDAAGEYTEATKPDAKSDWYGVTKRMAEEAIADTLDESDYAVIRIGSPFQASSHPKEDWLRRIANRLADGDPVSLFADTIVTPTWSADLGRAVTRVVQYRCSGIHHIFTRGNASPFWVGTRLCELLGCSASLVTKGSVSDFLAAHPDRFYPRRIGISIDHTEENLRLNMTKLDDALVEFAVGWRSEAS